MPQFSDKLDLKERAEEDIYFARRDRELIAALHEKDSGKKIPVGSKADRFGNTEDEAYGRTQVSGKGEGGPTHYHEVIRKILSKIHPPGRA
jgi:hypothetical protein